MIDVVLAAPDVPQEPELVAAAPGCGIRVLRRCVDVVDLLAAAAIDPSIVVVVSTGLPKLSPDAVGRLAAGHRGRVIGLAASPLDPGRLDALGVGPVVTVAPSAGATWRAVRDAVLDSEPRVAPAGESLVPGGSGVWATGAWGAASPLGMAGGEGPGAPGPPGQVIAVWGPQGSPGRTTVAIGIAEALADSGRRVCLVDADTYAPAVAMTLGLLDDAGGLVRVCRQADAGTLDPATLRAATVRPAGRRAHGTWQVISGIPRAERWPDLRAGALERVWESARLAFDSVVIDVGFCLEDDDAMSTWARRRNAAAVTALAAADHLVAVADASALGAARLLWAWPALAVAAPTCTRTVVRNRSGRGSFVRGSFVRGSIGRGREWVDAVREGGIDARVHELPTDDRALASCWSHGRSLGEGAGRSPLRRSLVTLAGALVSG